MKRLLRFLAYLLEPMRREEPTTPCPTLLDSGETLKGDVETLPRFVRARDLKGE